MLAILEELIVSQRLPQSQRVSLHGLVVYV
jgi:hypothetical protein